MGGAGGWSFQSSYRIQSLYIRGNRKLQELVIYLSDRSLSCRLISNTYHTRARIFKTFMEPRNLFQGINSASLYIAWRAGTITLFLLSA
jgi:hypothetical protein